MTNNVDHSNAEGIPPDSGRSTGSEVGVGGGGECSSSSLSSPGSAVGANVEVGIGVYVAVGSRVAVGSGVAVGVCFGVGVGCWAREIVPPASVNSPLSSNNAVKTNDP